MRHPHAPTMVLLINLCSTFFGGRVWKSRKVGPPDIMTAGPALPRCLVPHSSCPLLLCFFLFLTKTRSQSEHPSTIATAIETIIATFHDRRNNWHSTTIFCQSLVCLTNGIWHDGNKVETPMLPSDANKNTRGTMSKSPLYCTAVPGNGTTPSCI